jgi:hypothetical protein
MANLGSLSLTIGDHLDSGLALLLTKSPKESFEHIYKNAIFRISPDSKYCVCAFRGSGSNEDSVAIGTNLIQEFLDLLSMTGKEDIASKDSSDEYIAWWIENSRNKISFVTTATLKFYAGDVEITVQVKDGNIIHQPKSLPNYNIGFRFFRLAQVSDDLFDSFRNMYLAFEAFLSSIYPKGTGTEIDWLKSSLTNSQNILQLQKLVPAGVITPIDYVVDTIYNKARLQLFHSKNGKPRLVPSEPRDRQIVATALSLLTKIVIQMAESWYNCHRKNSWINVRAILEDQYNNQNDLNFLFSDNPNYTLNEPLDSKSVIDGFKFSAKYHGNFLNNFRPNIQGQFEISRIKEKGPLTVVSLLKMESIQVISSPESPLDLIGFDQFEMTLFIRYLSANQPKSLFSR